MRNGVVSNTVLAFLVFLFAGCSSQNLELGPEWKPLEQIKQSQLLAAGLGKEGARTIGDTVYVRDLKDFLAVLPEPLLTALLKHEQEHAVRQEKAGVYNWLAKYGTDTDFMRDEELRGWYLQITYIKGHGKDVNPAVVAKALAGYRNLSGSMISQAEALQWVNDVLSGKWKPN